MARGFGQRFWREGLDGEGVATGTPQFDALERGRAFAPLRGWRITFVGGTDAGGWLHDLITADVEGLPDRRSRRSLLLTPTGRIRADFHVAALDGSYVLLQASEQPETVESILRPYVLSSDVQIDDRTDRLVLVAVIGAMGAKMGEGSVQSDPDLVTLTPSVLGPGHDVVAPGDSLETLLEHLRASGSVEVSPTDLEAWRIRRGTPRMGADFGADTLPAEAGLEDAIDFTKGCFLGQESVARVRNLGHPPRVLLHVGSHAPVAPGASVVSGGAVVGEVTSAVPALDDVDAIVRVRWDADREGLSTAAGPLVLRNAR